MSDTEHPLRARIGETWIRDVVFAHVEKLTVVKIETDTTTRIEAGQVKIMRTVTSYFMDDGEWWTEGELRECGWRREDKKA